MSSNDPAPRKPASLMFVDALYVLGVTLVALRGMQLVLAALGSNVGRSIGLAAGDTLVWMFPLGTLMSLPAAFALRRRQKESQRRRLGRFRDRRRPSRSGVATPARPSATDRSAPAPSRGALRRTPL